MYFLLLKVQESLAFLSALSLSVARALVPWRARLTEGTCLLQFCLRAPVPLRARHGISFGVSWLICLSWQDLELIVSFQFSPHLLDREGSSPEYFSPQKSRKAHPQQNWHQERGRGKKSFALLLQVLYWTSISR